MLYRLLYGDIIYMCTKLCVNELCVNDLCADDLYVDDLCLDDLYVDDLLVDELEGLCNHSILHVHCRTIP